MISQGFSGFEIKFSMTIVAYTMNALTLLEKFSDCRVGRNKVLLYVLRKDLV